MVITATDKNALAEAAATTPAKSRLAQQGVYKFGKRDIVVGGLILLCAILAAGGGAARLFAQGYSAEHGMAVMESAADKAALPQAVAPHAAASPSAR